MNRKVLHAAVVLAVAATFAAVAVAVLRAPASPRDPRPAGIELPAPSKSPSAAAAPVPSVRSAMTVRIVRDEANPSSDLHVVVAFPVADVDQSLAMQRRFPSAQSWREVALDPSEGEASLYVVESLPGATRYLLAAWDGSGRVGARVVDGGAGSIDAGTLALEAPTAVEASIADAIDGHASYAVRLRCEPSPEIAADLEAWKYLVWRVAPEVFSACDFPPGEGGDAPRRLIEHSLLVSIAEPLRIAPLVPCRTAAIALGTRTGHFCDPRGMQLERGGTVSAALSPRDCLPADAVPCVEVSGRLVRESDGAPVADAQVIWADVELAFVQTATDTEGRFRFDCVPAPGDGHGHGHDHGHAPVEFRVVPRRDDSRPDELAEQRFDLHADDVKDGRAEVVWKLAALRWLDVTVPAERQREIAERSAEGFPVQMLERWSEAEARWIAERPAAVKFTADGFRVAAPSTGRMRAVVALSPFETLVAGEAASGDSAAAFAAEQRPAKTIRLRLVDAYEGAPIANSSVTVRSLPGVPGVPFASDAEGIVVLPPANVAALEVLLPNGETTVVDLANADETVEVSVSGP